MRRLCGHDETHTPHRWTIDNVDRVFNCSGVGISKGSIYQWMPGLDFESWPEGSISREYVRIAWKYKISLKELEEWDARDIATLIELAELEEENK